MKKRVVWMVIVSLGLFFAASVHAEEDRQKEAEALLDAMHMDTVFTQAVDQMMDLQLKQMPALAPYRDIMDRFMKKYMSYASLKPDMVKLYAQTFTKDELNDLAAFYRTSTGQKAVQVMPQLMAQGAQLGQARVQEHMPELQQQIQEEMTRQQQQQQQQQQAAPKK